MNKEGAIPMIFVPIPLLSASFLFSASILLLTAIPIFSLLPCFPMPSMSDHNAGSRRSPRAATLLNQTFALGIIGSYLMLGIN